MEKTSAYPEELREVGEAAMLLSTQKYLILDRTTATALNKLKSKYLNQNRAVHNRRVEPYAQNQQNGQEVDDSKIKQNHQAHPELPQFEPALQGWNPPNIPPVPRLDGLIRDCSKPLVKKLTDSDVKDNKSRLVMSKKHVVEFFLPQLIGKESIKDGILVTIYDSEGSEFVMAFKFWSEKYYVLTTGWTKFYQKHELIEDDSIAIWMFRHVKTNQPCFVITYRKELGNRVLIKRPRKRHVQGSKQEKSQNKKFRGL